MLMFICMRSKDWHSRKQLSHLTRNTFSRSKSSALHVIHASSSETFASRRFLSHGASCWPVSATRQWVDDVVIGMKLCPWAKPVSDRSMLRYRVSNACNIESLLQDASDEISLLEKSLLPNPPSDIPETTLLIVDNTDHFIPENSDVTDSATRFLGDFRL